jgi:hypothetical protein
MLFLHGGLFYALMKHLRRINRLQNEPNSIPGVAMPNNQPSFVAKLTAQVHPATQSGDKVRTGSMAGEVACLSFR